MRFSLRLRRPAAPPPVQPASASRCADCASGLLHCHGTLVLHADGTAECAEPACGLDAAAHEHWVACTELVGCGCTGDDHLGWVEGPLAA